MNCETSSLLMHLLIAAFFAVAALMIPSKRVYDRGVAFRERIIAHTTWTVLHPIIRGAGASRGSRRVASIVAGAISAMFLFGALKTCFL
jgi:hypothetical protein